MSEKDNTIKATIYTVLALLSVGLFILIVSGSLLSYWHSPDTQSKMEKNEYIKSNKEEILFDNIPPVKCDREFCW